jgi:HAD superfamily hydrolase (TIGR01490 family)
MPRITLAVWTGSGTRRIGLGEMPYMTDNDGFFMDASAAFFDLDRTILRTDSDLAWALFRARRDPVGLIEILRLVALSLPYKNGTIDPKRYLAYHRYRIDTCSGKYDEMTERFFAERGKALVRPAMALLIERYRAAQVPVIIITAQNRGIASRFAGHLGVDRLIANDFIGPEGEAEQPPCLGEGKVLRAQAWAREMGLCLSRSVYYGDSINDAPLLELVGFPVAVSPDRKLEALALERRWPIFGP